MADADACLCAPSLAACVYAGTVFGDFVPFPDGGVEWYKWSSAVIHEFSRRDAVGPYTAARRDNALGLPSRQFSRTLEAGARQ